MRSLQEEFNLSSGDFILEPGEYEGPLVIKRPCVFDGSNATLWADKGPVLVIEAPGIMVRGLRVEVTGPSGGRGSAIRTSDPQTVLEGVEVCGNIEGLAGETTDWRLPQNIFLGEFCADAENLFVIELDAAGDAELSCDMRDVEIFPTHISAGKNRIDIRTGHMRDNTILYGEILVHTAVTRRIYLTGKALIGAPQGRAEAFLPLDTPADFPVSAPPEIIAPAGEDGNVTYITRGQRIPAGELQEGLVKIVYEHKYAEPGMGIDGYTFLLKENGKVRGDQDLIFFGNPESEDGAVRVSSASGRPLMLAELSRLGDWVGKLAVCCSIYGDKLRENFSLVDSPMIRVFHDNRELYRFPLSDLRTEKTVVAVEIYRYKGEWKLNFVGAGYRSGLKELCESYGVQVE